MIKKKNAEIRKKMAKSLREHLFTKETPNLLETKRFFFFCFKKEENNFGICQDNRNMTNLGYLSVVLVQQKVVCRCVIWIASPRRIQKTLAKHGTNVELTMIMANALSSLPLLYTFV